MFSPPAARHRRHLIQEPALAHPSPALDQDDGPDAGRWGDRGARL